jgi:hypothetical protein
MWKISYLLVAGLLGLEFARVLGGLILGDKAINVIGIVGEIERRNGSGSVIFVNNAPA